MSHQIAEARFSSVPILREARAARAHNAAARTYAATTDQPGKSGLSHSRCQSTSAFQYFASKVVVLYFARDEFRGGPLYPAAGAAANLIWPWETRAMHWEQRAGLPLSNGFSCRNPVMGAGGRLSDFNTDQAVSRPYWNSVMQSPRPGKVKMPASLFAATT